MGLLAKFLDLELDDQPYQFPRGPTPETRDQVHWGKRCHITGIMPITGTCYENDKKGVKKRYICSSAYANLGVEKKKLYKAGQIVDRKKKHKLTDVYYLPYDKKGKLLPAEKRDPENMLKLDLRVGAEIKMSFGSFKGDLGNVIRHSSTGNFVLGLKHDTKKKYAHGQKHRPHSVRTLGRWMVEAASKGKLSHLPCINNRYLKL
jgi:hypothetical protein